MTIKKQIAESQTKARRFVPKNAKSENERKYKHLLKKHGLSELDYGPHIPEIEPFIMKRQQAFEDTNDLEEFGFHAFAAVNRARSVCASDDLATSRNTYTIAWEEA